MHRYGAKLDRRLAAIRASTEAAKIIQAHAGDDKDARSEALTAMVQTELFEAILELQEAVEGDEKSDPGERVALLSKAAKNIATLTRSSVNLKSSRPKPRRARKRAFEEAAAMAVTTAKAQGLSDIGVDKLREAIMGNCDGRVAGAQKSTMAQAIFMAYQVKWVEDQSPVKIMEKSRRIGLSYAEAADDVLYAASASGPTSTTSPTTRR